MHCEVGVDWECCWSSEVIDSEGCPQVQAGEEELLASRERRILEKCLDCESFRRDLSRFRESGHPFAQTFSLVHGEFLRQKNHIQSLIGFLDSKTLEIRFLHEVATVLQSSVELEEVLSVALTAITAGKGFGMNRAFLLLTDREHWLLNGYLAIGPRNLEEASQIWQEVAGMDVDLQTLAQNFRSNKLSAERAKFRDILEQLTFPLTDTGHILVRALDGRHPVLIENAFHNPEVDPRLAALLGVDTFLLMPLISRNRRVGIIIADNCITRRRITDEDMRSLETFAFPVAFAIERAALYDRLQEELQRATVAGAKLREQQELIVRMEKMALMGRVTSSIAHSIRNPLMIIGGFARSMLKNSPDSDPRRDFLESIVTETRQLEGVLDEILNYSDSLHPSRDFWDVNQLVEAALRETSVRLQAWGCEGSLAPGEGLPMAYIDYKQFSYCLRTMIVSDIDSCRHGRVDISTHAEGDRIIVTVTDTSVRLTQEALDALLEPFSSTLDLGNGLGLALCATMLERQEIPFSARLLPESGIVYTISLPTRKEEQI